MQGYGAGHHELEFRAARVAVAARHRACPSRRAAAGPLPPGSLIDSLHGYYTQPPADPFASLTPRECQIVAVTIEWNGAPNKCLTGSLGISENTLRNALSIIFAKTRVAIRASGKHCVECHRTASKRYGCHVRSVTALPAAPRFKAIA